MEGSLTGTSGLPTKVTGQRFKVGGGFLGISDGGGFIVDKSLLCKAFLEGKEDVVRVCLPRRFGKSFNLGVLAEFFNVVTVNDCPPDTDEPTLDLTRELRERRFADSLLKQNHPEFFMTHFARYPVIRIDFKASTPLWLQYVLMGTPVSMPCD
ncbi:hypothetical protein LPJ61_006311 [Coemansia biformis]|uniref:AAA-ATPase-like domain-containing protein n=1 Tax=Coemansia biformis TaxID=1286918 RepID=A0A9W8CQ25_9FUNG|nr:hypothetical protein LPJ61_006311 [Coemansia biformis]